jgi:plasmid maintenance system antidote protein VapI
MINMSTGKWITSPGDVVRDAIEDGVVRRDELRDALGLGEVEFMSLLSGELVLSASLAKGLAKSIGGSQIFWENSEKRYRKQRQENAKTLFCAPAKVNKIRRVYKTIGCYAYS